MATDASPTTLSDDELLAVARRADVRAVNGLPDPKTIARHPDCPLSRTSVTRRLRRLADEGGVTLHESIVAGENHGGTLLTVDVEAES